MRRKEKVITILLICLLFITMSLLLVNRNYNLPPEIKSIKYANKFNDDKTRTASLKIKKHNTNDIYCQFVDGDNKSDWILVKKGICSYNVVTKSYTVNLKYNDDKIVSYDKDFYIDAVLGLKVNNRKEYMALGETFNLESQLDSIGMDSKIEYNSSNPDVITIDNNGNVTGHNVGTSEVTVSTLDKFEVKLNITVSDLIRPPVLDNNKKRVPCNSYTKEQVEELDRILESRVNNAGPGTRAAVAVAARFLTLEFPYKVPYFYENGRLTGNGVQGEGRYYKKGLYLGVNKQKEITKVMAGPASWGCPLMNYEDDGYRTPNTRYPNGFDCSGYVTWVLVQAGLDLGDIGAGPGGSKDYTDIGPLRRNSYDLLHSGEVKVGDLIGWDGHIAIIGAMSDTKIYITESLLPGVIMDEYDYSDPNAKFYRRYDYIIDMTDNYKGDGNLRNMW